MDDSSPQSKNKGQEGKSINKRKLRKVASGGAASCSVEEDCVQEGPAALLLKLQWLIDLVFHVLIVLNVLEELTAEVCPHGGLFVVFVDASVDHVHWLAGLLLSGIQIFHQLVLHSVFSGEDQVKQVFAVLEPFWPGLDLLISVQHVQNAVLRVELFVFPKEITVHLIIYSFEIINIGLVGC